MTKDAVPGITYQFDAFISYSHKKDRDLARSLERTLRVFGRKWFEIRKLKTYRDETNLSAEPNLWNKIESAVLQSRHLVLLASPESAKSSWVPKEVQASIDAHGVSALCIVQTDGVLPWTDGIPAHEMTTRDDAAMAASVVAQLESNAAIPMVVDLRPYRAMRDVDRERNPEYLSLVAAIAAKLLGVDKENIWGSYYHAQKMWAAVLSISVIVLLVLLLSLGILYKSEVLQTALATSRAIAADARLQVNQELRQALSSSSKAYLLSPSIDAQTALLESLNRASHVVSFYPCPNGQKQGNVTFSGEPPYAMAFSCAGPTEGSITAVSADGTKVQRLSVEKDVRALTFVDQHTLAIDGSPELRLIDLKTGKINVFSSNPSTPDTEKISLLASAPRRGFVFSASGADTIRVWRRSGDHGSWVGSILARSDGAIGQLRWHEPDSKLRIVRYDGTSRLIAVAPDGAATADAMEYPVDKVDARCHGHAISSRLGVTAQAKDSATIAYNTEDNSVVVDRGFGSCELYHGNTHNFALAISPDGGRIASVGAIEDGDNIHGAILWSATQVHPLATELHPGNPTIIRSPTLTLSRDGASWACSTCGEGSILWDGNPKELPAPLSGYDVTSLTLSPDGGELAVSFKDGSLVRVRKGDKDTRVIKGRAKAPIKQLWFGKHSLYLAHSDGSIWRLRGGAASFDELVRPSSTAGSCADVHFAGDRIAFETPGGKVSLVGLSSGAIQEIHLPEDAGMCSGLAFSPHTAVGVRLPLDYGNLFVFEDGLLGTTVSRWKNPLHDPSGLSRVLSFPRLSDQGSRLAALDTDNNIVLFDVAERRAVGVLHSGQVRAFALSANGKRLIAYSDEAGLVLWNTDPDGWQAAAMRLANDPLTIRQ